MVRWTWMAALLVIVPGCSAGDAPPPSAAPPGPTETEPAVVGAVEPAPAPRAARTVRMPPETTACTTPPPSPFSLERGLVFGYDRGHPIALDLAVPHAPGPHPFVLLVHGGGWRAGERAHVEPEQTTLAGQGYAAATVDYRLLTRDGDHGFPAQIADVRCALRHLRRNASRFDLDPDRAAVLGYSSGAHLALLLGTGADVGALDGADPTARCEDLGTPVTVSAVVAFFGVADVRPDVAFPRPSERLIDRLLGGPRRERLDLATLASPAAHVSATDAPTLLFHATEDPVVPVAQSRLMRAALSGAGVPVRYIEVPGRRHGFRAFPAEPGADRRVPCTTLAFLEATLRSPRGASRSAGADGSRP